MTQGLLLHGRRILVVEDIFVVAEEISVTLKEQGCTILGPAVRRDRALELARDEAMDGALLDINLAGEMSFPVAVVLRGRGIPFVFLTGYDAAAVPAELRDTACLNKPFEPKDLLAITAAMLA